MKIFFLLIIFLSSCSSCQFNKQRINNEQDKENAEKVVADLYRYLDKKEIDSAGSLFDPRFAGNDSVKFRQSLINMCDQVPLIKERVLDHWRTHVITGLNAGTHDTLFYINKYEGGQVLKISVQLVNAEDNTIKIAGYQADINKFNAN